jgi:hypothetical protein
MLWRVQGPFGGSRGCVPPAGRLWRGLGSLFWADAGREAASVLPGRSMARPAPAEAPGVFSPAGRGSAGREATLVGPKTGFGGAKADVGRAGFGPALAGLKTGSGGTKAALVAPRLFWGQPGSAGLILVVRPRLGCGGAKNEVCAGVRPEGAGEVGVRAGAGVTKIGSPRLACTTPLVT